ncbi:MAG: beta-mannosidase, partial [Lentisphaerae bacterium]
MFSQDLNGTWQLRHEHLAVAGIEGYHCVHEKANDWLAATVPGEVHLDLIQAGLMEEPLVSDHAFQARWPENRSWWYRLNFTPDEEVLAQERQELVFHGLDYYAQIFLNGEFIGEWENAFIPAVFDVTHHLTGGENELLVRLTAGTERARNQKTGEDTPQNRYGHRQSFAGIVELRKPQFTYGWDWVETLPNIGIWRAVELRGYSKLRIHDVRCLIQLAEDQSTARLTIVGDIRNIHPWQEHLAHIQIRLFSPSDHLEHELELQQLIPTGISRIEQEITIPNPQLWWPNGYGGQPLYRLQVSVGDGKDECDRWERQIGLRTITIERSPLPEGHRFALNVNGTRIFCKGANWIPADAILARVTEEKYHALLQNARDASFNMLRVWGGGIYENEVFYDLCDRLGILVWQDFMFACNPYPDHIPSFREKIAREAQTIIRRLRHHPSIALWCGNNENLWGFKNWWGNDRFDYPDKRLKLGGYHLYSQILPELCLDLDPQRPYWPGSPAGGHTPQDETEGDVHWWHPATMHPDISRRYRDEVYDECRARFVSEYGVIGPCHLDSWREYLHPGEMDPEHPVARLHINRFEEETIPAAIRYHYTDPEHLDLAQYIRYGQAFQALLYGRSLEAIRFRKGDPVDDCAGALFWMYDDCWGETGWTPIDYYLRRKPAYYWIKKAFHPLRTIIRRRQDELVVRIINDRLQSFTGRLNF